MSHLTVNEMAPTLVPSATREAQPLDRAPHAEILPQAIRRQELDGVEARVRSVCDVPPDRVNSVIDDIDTPCFLQRPGLVRFPDGEGRIYETMSIDGQEGVSVSLSLNATDPRRTTVSFPRPERHGQHGSWSSYLTPDPLARAILVEFQSLYPSLRLADSIEAAESIAPGDIRTHVSWPQLATTLHTNEAESGQIVEVMLASSGFHARLAPEGAEPVPEFVPLTASTELRDHHGEPVAVYARAVDQIVAAQEELDNRTGMYWVDLGGRMARYANVNGAAQGVAVSGLAISPTGELRSGEEIEVGDFQFVAATVTKRSVILRTGSGLAFDYDVLDPRLTAVVDAALEAPGFPADVADRIRDQRELASQ